MSQPAFPPIDWATLLSQLRAMQEALLRSLAVYRADGARPPEPALLSEPSPSPWKDAVRSVVATISLRDVAEQMGDGREKDRLRARIDRAVSRFIDDWDTSMARLPPWPWPPPGPLSEEIASELAVIASTLPEGETRSGVLEVASRIVQNASGSASRKALPSEEELAAMTAFRSGDTECQYLCRDYLTTMDELKSATGDLQTQLQARLSANSVRRKQLQCKLCLPD